MLFYRYEIKEKNRCILCDFIRTINEVVLFEFEVEKETLGGYWIKQTTQDGKLQKTCSKSRVWVAKGNAVKAFARTSKERALRDLLYRTEKRCKITSIQHQVAKQCLDDVNDFIKDLNEKK